MITIFFNIGLLLSPYINWGGGEPTIVPAVITLFIPMKAMLMMMKLTKYVQKNLSSMINLCLILGWAVGMGVYDTPFNVKTMETIAGVL